MFVFVGVAVGVSVAVGVRVVVGVAVSVGIGVSVAVALGAGVLVLAGARAGPISGVLVSAMTPAAGLGSDLFIRKYGPERYLKLSEKSRTGLEFLISTMKRSYKLDVPEDKSRLVSALMREIDKIPDAVTKSEYLRQMSNDLNVDEKLLRGMAQQEKPVRKDENGDLFLPAEKRLLQILAEGGTVGRWIASCLKEDDVTGLKGEPLFRFLLDSLRKDKGLQFQDMQQAVGAPLASQLSRVLFEKQQESTELDAGECIKSLRRMRLENRLKELQREIVRVEKRGEKEKLAPLLYQRQSITKEIMAL